MPTTMPAEGHPLSGQLAAVILLAAILAFPISFALLNVYRRRVLASMRVRKSPPPRTAEDPRRGAGPASTDFRVVRSEPATIVRGTEATRLHAALARAVRRTGAVYLAAGTAFAIVMAAAWVLSADADIRLLPLAVVGWCFGWPVLVSLDLVVAATWAERVRLAAVYFVGLILIGALAVAVSTDFSVSMLVALWLILNLPASLLVLLFLSRPVRAVGPLVLAFLLVGMAGMTAAMSAAWADDAIPRALAEIGVALGLPALVLVLGLTLAGAVILAPLGWVLGRRLGRLYEEKHVSDELITIDSLWVLFGLSQAMVLVSSGGPIWLLLPVLAFAAYKVVQRLGFRALGVQQGGVARPPSLLVLRAFSLGKRSERLFSALTMKWRHAGSVQLICGPDLARTTIEPHEFLDFLRGRIARRFIDGPAALERRIEEMDFTPDPDGRYRVNEFFCHDDVWRTALRRLVSLSDAVLTDLRGFSREHAGLAFEVRELVRTVPLASVVAVVDDATDFEYLREVAAGAWTPPTSGDERRQSAVLRVLHVSTPADYDAALRAVCAASEFERIAA